MTKSLLRPFFRFALLLNFLIAINAHGSSADIGKAIRSAQGHFTSEQKIVYAALENYAKNLQNCGALLSPIDPDLGIAALEQGPTWLVQAARLAFVDQTAIDPQLLSRLENHNLAPATTFGIDGVTSAVADQIKNSVRHELIDTNPMTERATSSVAIGLRKISVKQKPGQNTVSFELNLQYDNGEKQALVFTNAPIGSLEIPAAISRFVVAAINHRAVLSSSDNLRREMNALRFNLQKLMRVTSPDLEGQLNDFSRQLVDNQPVARTGWKNLLGIGPSDSQSVGTAFLTYLLVKEQIIQIAQRAQEQQADRIASVRGDSARAKLDTDYVSRGTQGRPQANSRSGYFYPKAQTVRTTTTVSSPSPSYNNLSLMWMMDPSFMFSHPWYWGVSDNSFGSSFMMLNWMVDSTRYQNPQPYFQPNPQDYTQSQMANNFNQPVNPTFTNNAQNPAIDPWNVTGNIAGVITAQTTPDGNVQWQDHRGGAVDVSGVPSVQDAWSNITGAPLSNGATPVSEPLSAPDSDRFQKGNDGTGFTAPDNNPAPVQDPSIRSS